MFICVLVVFVLLTLFVPLNNISNCELLEEYKLAKNMIEVQGQRSNFRLFLFRAAAITISCALAYITDEVSVVVNLVGAVIIPILIFYLPMLMNTMHAKVYGIKRNNFIKLHDFVMVLLSVGV